MFGAGSAASSPAVCSPTTAVTAASTDAGGRQLRALRARVFAVHGRRCADCGRAGVALEVHHVNGEPTDNRIANLRPLCRDCHRLATFPRAAAGRARRQIFETCGLDEVLAFGN